MDDQILGIKRREWPLALLLSAYFFLIITSFWILKPIKKTLFLEFYRSTGWEFAGLSFTGPQAELFAKVLNMVVAFAAAALFSALSDRFRRQQLTLIFSAGIFAGFIAYAYWLQYPSSLVVWSFYLFGDLYNTLMVATFFAFVNDSTDAAGAKRMYGVIGLGGVVGGAVGSTFVRTSIAIVSYPGWMAVSLVLGMVIVGLAIAAGWMVAQLPVDPLPSDKRATPSDTPHRSPAIEGARLVFQSRYLLALVALVALYEMASTILDFQFTAAIDYFGEHHGLDVGSTLATTYTATNWLALLVQLAVTPIVMQRFGVGSALLFLPIMALVSSASFVLIPLALTAGALSVSDNAFNYSINQSARESLYTVTTREEKYKAKAFIDMFIQRFAKALAVGLNLLMTSLVSGLDGVRSLTLVTIPLLIGWVLIARYLGNHFRQKEETP